MMRFRRVEWRTVAGSTGPFTIGRSAFGLSAFGASLAGLTVLGLAGCSAKTADLGYRQHSEGAKANPIASEADAARPDETSNPDDTPNTNVPSTTTADTEVGTLGPPGGTNNSQAAGTCTNAVTCGGDVVGTWTVKSSCLDVTGALDAIRLGLGCSSLPLTGYLNASGSFTANDDGTYVDNTLTTGVEHLRVPESCLEISGTLITCEQMVQALAILGHTTATCAIPADGQECTCEVEIHQNGGMGLLAEVPLSNGTYEVTDDVLTLSGTYEDAPYSFCAAASTLTVRPLSTAQGTLTGVIELERTVEP